MFRIKKSTMLEKNSVIKPIYKYPKCLEQISKYSIKFATPDFFIENLQLLNNNRDLLYIYNFPNLNIIDDYGLLFMFKIYSLFEKKKYYIVEIPYFNKISYIFNNNISREEIYRHIVIQSCRINNKYINITTEERNIILSIQNYENIDYDKNKDKLFYYYLRLIIMTSQDFNIKGKKYLDGDKIKKDFLNVKKYFTNAEKFLKKYWDELLKENPHYEADMKKQFDINYKSLMEKIDHFMKSSEYKSYRRNIHIKPFKFPLKKFFGSEKPLQYKMFADLIDEFKKTDDYQHA
jgi:hypothetical protein